MGERAREGGGEKKKKETGKESDSEKGVREWGEREREREGEGERESQTNRIKI